MVCLGFGEGEGWGRGEGGGGERECADGDCFFFAIVTTTCHLELARFHVLSKLARRWVRDRRESGVVFAAFFFNRLFLVFKETKWDRI